VVIGQKVKDLQDSVFIFTLLYVDSVRGSSQSRDVLYSFLTGSLNGFACLTVNFELGTLKIPDAVFKSVFILFVFKEV